MQRTNPASVHPPRGLYSHSIRVPAGADLVFISGQVGVDETGTVMQGARQQARQVLTNLGRCLEAEGMTFSDIVRLTVYLTNEADIPAIREERLAFLGDKELPTATLLVVKGLAQPELLVEIDAIAAK